MFGKLLTRHLLIALILLGLCLYVVQLFVEDDINFYIHPRYNIFSVVMASLAIGILLLGIVVDILKSRRVRHDHDTIGNGKIVNGIVVVVLGLALVLPAQSLSSQTIADRTLNTPATVAEQLNQEGNREIPEDCPEYTPPSLDVWVYDLGSYSPDCYEGTPIAITGSVTESTQSTLPSEYYYLGRTIISCCAIDATPYAIVTKKDSNTYEVGSWWTVQGTFQIENVGGIEQLVIVPQSVKQVEEPDTPYEYIDMPSMDQLQPIEVAPVTQL